jgi:hypothetical protein
VTRAVATGAALAALAVAAAGPAHADELNFAALSAERPNVLSLRTGMEGGIVGEVGYRRVLGSRASAVLGLDLSAPLAELDTSDYRVRAVLAGPLLAGPHWKLVGALGPTLRSSENPLNRAHALGADGRVTGGYYAPGWFAAGELGFELVGGTYIRNSERYRKYVYADAKDGWYRDTGGTFYVGAHGGLSFSGVDVVLRLGHPRAWTLEPKSIPFFATVGANVSF